MSNALRELYPPEADVSLGAVSTVRVCDPEEGLTRQSEAAACDINRIVRSYVSQGMPLPVRPDAVFADVSQGWDYREAIEKAREVEEYFLGLPADLRAKYRNDPGAFLDGILLPENVEDAVRLGLVEAPVPEVPNEVPADPPA